MPRAKFYLLKGDGRFVLSDLFSIGLRKYLLHGFGLRVNSPRKDSGL